MSVADRAAGDEGEGPRRLLVVSHSLSGGGAERFASTLLVHLPRSVFTLRLAVAVRRLDFSLPDDVEVVDLGYRGLVTLPRTLRRLRRAIRRYRPRLVLSNILSTNCLAGAALAAATPRPRWVARVGNAPEVSEPWLHALWARRVYPRADAVVVNAAAMEAGFVARYPGIAGKVTALPNPIDFDAIDERAAEGLPVPPAAGPLIVAVGRLTRQKRPDVLVDAFARIRRRLDATLWICGEGPLEEEVRRRAAAAGVGDAVELVGFQPNPFPLLARADLFVMTSDHEGLPNALIEAQGLGVPAVATRCPYGPGEIVADGETGRLVPPGDLEAVAAAALELLADPERLRAMGEAARRRARSRYGLEVALPRWEALLARVAGGRG